MSSQKFDALELVLKKDLKINLNEQEEAYLNTVDTDTKEDFLFLLNNNAFLEVVKDLTDKIIKKSSLLSIEEQQYILSQCQNRIKELEDSTSKKESSDICDKKLKKC